MPNTSPFVFVRLTHTKAMFYISISKGKKTNRPDVTCLLDRNCGEIYLDKR